MHLRDFKFGSPNYRWIQEKDKNSKFDSGMPAMDAISMSDFYNHSKEPNIMVIVGKSNRNISAVIELEYKNNQKSLVVNYIKVDGKCQGQGIGSNLLDYAERLGKKLNCDKILLDAVKNRFEFYNRYGFNQNGEPFIDKESPEWGILIPMTKDI